MAGYDDEPTAEELAAMEAEDNKLTDVTDATDPAVPPAEDDDSKPITPEVVAAEQGLGTDGKPVVDPNAAPAVDPATGEPAAPATDDKALSAFLEKHKGKTPEQLLELAFQQQSRANNAGFQARQTKEQLEAMTASTQAAVEQIRARREALKTGKTTFAEKLAADPDAATADLHDRLTAEDDARLAQEEHDALRTHAQTIASTAIPHFSVEAMRDFGREMNYSPQELDGVTDPRDMVTLHLAGLTGRLIKSGILDLEGNVLSGGPAVVTTDPRLTGKDPVQTLTTAPGRGNTGGLTLDAQLSNVLAMTDAEMEKFEAANPGLIDTLLKKAN